MRGQIFQRGKSKSWTVRVYLGRQLVRDETTGAERWREHHQWRTFPARQEAERYLHQVLATLEGGGVLAVTRKRMGEYLAEWIRGHAPHLAATTLASYRETIRVHLAPYFGHIRLTRLSPQVVREYIGTKLAAGLSPKTVSNHRIILRRAMEEALREGLIVRNPVALVPALPRHRKDMAALDMEQVRLLLGEARRSSPYYRLYLSALTTGARQGELLGLRWKDCDLLTGQASVQQTFYRLSGSKQDGTRAQQLFKAPKTAKSRRTIPLAPEMVAELLILRDEQREQRRRLGDRYYNFDLVFCQPNGKPLHANNVVQRDFRKVLERAKLPRIRFHDLRHTVATLHLRRGVHPKIVQELLGHSSVQTTLDVYTHAIPGMAEEAVRNLGALVAIGPPSSRTSNAVERTAGPSAQP